MHASDRVPEHVEMHTKYRFIPTLMLLVSQLLGALEKNRQDWERWGVQELMYEADRLPIWRLAAEVITVEPVSTPAVDTAELAAQTSSRRLKDAFPEVVASPALAKSVALSFHPFFRAFVRCIGLLVTRTGPHTCV